MQRVTALFCGLLRDAGQKIRFTGQSAAGQTRIDTTDYTLRLSMADGALALQLDASVEDSDQKPGTVLARLIRAASAVLRPSAIRWRDGARLLDIATWLSAFRPVQPRRVPPTGQAVTARRPDTVGVAIWPDRPCDLPPARRRAALPDSMTTRFARWHPTTSPAPAANRVGPEPLPHRLSSWTLNGTIGLLCPPAGASMAVLNLTRRADLRLNLLAFALTLGILSLQQSGALAAGMRALGF